MARMLLQTVGVACILLSPLARNAAAQTPAVAAPVERLSFDRPEAWALKYFTTTTLINGLDAPDRLRAGSVVIGLEAGWVPRLTTAQQRVGFYGTMSQDLNKAPLLVRPRVKIGLPGRLALSIAATPPVRTFDVTPRLVAASLEGPLLERGAWSLGWRTYGQLGTVTSAVTCPSEVLAFPAGSAGNRLGCEAESADVATLRYAGVELGAAHRIDKLRGLTPHLSAGINAIDGVFQTDARTFGYIDRTRFETNGVTFSLSTGLAYALTDRLAVAVDAFYSPLTVRRSFNADRSNDPLLNARALIAYRVR